MRTGALMALIMAIMDIHAAATNHWESCLVRDMGVLPPSELKLDLTASLKNNSKCWATTKLWWRKTNTRIVQNGTHGPL